MQPYGQYPQGNQNWRGYQQWPDPGDFFYPLMPTYTGKAFFVLVLYFCGYFPGLIANIICLLQALDTKAQFGRYPYGLGCLTFLLIMFTVGLVAIFLLMYFMLVHLY